MTVLERIMQVKRVEVQGLRRAMPLAMLGVKREQAPPVQDFKAAIQRKPNEGIKLIAELKKKSPSKGTIRPDFDPALLLQTYEQSPASAVSVLTDWTFFGGKIEHLELARKLTTKPVLRKDFIFDAYQVHEGRAFGADAVLLIASVLDQKQLADLVALTSELKMAALVETHTAEEVEAALSAGADIIGINNRDLKTFQVDFETTLKLRPMIPTGIVVVSESGIERRDDVKRLEDAGVDAILVGETLMKAKDPPAKAKELLGMSGE